MYVWTSLTQRKNNHYVHMMAALFIQIHSDVTDYFWKKVNCCVQSACRVKHIWGMAVHQDNRAAGGATACTICSAHHHNDPEQVRPHPDRVSKRWGGKDRVSTSGIYMQWMKRTWEGLVDLCDIWGSVDLWWVQGDSEPIFINRESFEKSLMCSCECFWCSFTYNVLEPC